jgi:hypothetical protein
VDILGNEELLLDLLKLVSKKSDTESHEDDQPLADRIVSRIDAIAARIPWEDADGWENFV